MASRKLPAADEIHPVELIATFRPEQVRSRAFGSYIRDGVSIVRLNASHCGVEELRQLAPILKMQPVRVMLDLPGPELRILGYAESIPLSKGKILDIGSASGSVQAGFSLPPDLRVGEPALLMNGEIEAVVCAITPSGFTLLIMNPGILRPNAHITFPRQEGSYPYPTTRDRELAKLACELGWHYLALSMPSSGADVQAVRDIIQAGSTGTPPLLVAKIETVPALENMEAIIAAADAIFVARGDLGVRILLEAIPIAQKQITSACLHAGKPVFIATQMLSSMTASPVPTRAELSDVANAVLDGASGITLSEETAIGQYPREAIQIARKVIAEALSYLDCTRNDSLTTAGELPFPMSPSLDKLLGTIGRIGELIWARGWAEANAGNVSIRVDDLIPARHRKKLHWYLVSRSGSRYRQIADDPLKELLLVTDDGERWEQVSGEGTPTSEWQAHLALQRWAISSGDPAKVILHAHPEPIVALGGMDIFQDEAELNRILADILPELPIYMPEGIACCPLCPPGSMQLADATLDCAPRSRVIIWQKHGILCRAADPDAAFDLMEIVTKAANVYLRILHN